MSAKPGDTDHGRIEREEETFLRRWSRRKHETVREEASEAPPPPAAADAAPPPAPVLTDADMPPIESLTPESDFSGFMSPGVSEALRQQALRVLFRSPSLNVRCPLDSEYYDCANTTPLGSIITHDMREEMAREAKKRLAALGRDATQGGAGAAAGGEPLGPIEGDGRDIEKTNHQGGHDDA